MPACGIKVIRQTSAPQAVDRHADPAADYCDRADEDAVDDIADADQHRGHFNRVETLAGHTRRRLA